MSLALILPTQGLAHGEYPERRDNPDAAELHDLLRALRSRLAWPRATRLPRRLHRAYLTRLHELKATAERRIAPRTEPAAELDVGLEAAAQFCRDRLRRRGLDAVSAGQALALAAFQLERTLRLSPYDTQVLAAWLMLQGQLVEMATGEGKTIAAALAAAVAGLAGCPVHVLTANDYLVGRDQLALAPFYAALGLRSAAITNALSGDQRRSAWTADVVYATASELAFDYLGDHLRLQGERSAHLQRVRSMAGDAGAEPLLPGLCLCLLDEADSLLLDEAVMPLILAQPAGPLDIEAYRTAFALSLTLQREHHYTLDAATRSATLSRLGRERISAAVAGARNGLHPARRACEWVQAALAARLLYHRDHHYVVQGGTLQLIDELTGRLAMGRQWQGALHPMVQLKEGLEPSAPTTTAAQITYQRFFPRYLHLAGMSGTLLEARHELRVLYDVAVSRVPLARPGLLLNLGERCFASACERWAAVMHAVREQQAAGRPVLVGTASVHDSAHLSALLQRHGIAHQVLNATQDADEAECIAQAGRSGRVTVSTNIAGRGTDIRLDAAAIAAGGLHVIATARNRSRRIDRQLFGRAARHGDPGSAQALLALDDHLLQQTLPAWLVRSVRAWAGRFASPGRPLPGWCTRPLFALAQRRAEGRDRQHRRELRHADREASELHAFSGGTE